MDLYAILLVVKTASWCVVCARSNNHAFAWNKLYAVVRTINRVARWSSCPTNLAKGLFKVSQIPNLNAFPACASSCNNGP
jgi:hypothetical protein